jgi:predicted RNA binding protein YcfA (HicA-like mRNA interferase family)
MTLPAVTKPITRENVNAYLDAHELCAAMGNGKWWRIRRNGSTRYWKRDASRIYVPIKAGLKSYYAITETDFGYWIDKNAATLNPESFRHVDDLPDGSHT